MAVKLKKTEEVEVTEIKTDEAFQFRCGSGPFGTEKDHIAQYAELIKEGVEFPPVNIVELSESHGEYPIGSLMLIGGFTRYFAHIHAGKQLINATITPGTWQDARCMSFAENATHGKRRTIAELHKVLAAIDHDYKGLTTRKVAAMALCTHQTVSNFRNRGKEASAEAKRIEAELDAPQGTTQGTPKSTKPSDTPKPTTAPRAATEDDEDDIIEPHDHDEPEPADDDTGEYQPAPAPRPEPAKPAEAKADEWAEMREGRKLLMEAAQKVTEAYKICQVAKGHEYGAALKLGDLQKWAEDFSRHLRQYAPYAIITPEAIEESGQHPQLTNPARPWLTKQEATGFPKEVQELLQSV